MLFNHLNGPYTRCPDFFPPEAAVGWVLELRRRYRYHMKLEYLSFPLISTIPWQQIVGWKTRTNEAIFWLAWQFSNIFPGLWPQDIWMKMLQWVPTSLLFTWFSPFSLRQKPSRTTVLFSPSLKMVFLHTGVPKQCWIGINEVMMRLWSKEPDCIHSWCWHQSPQ